MQTDIPQFIEVGEIVLDLAPVRLGAGVEHGHGHVARPLPPALPPLLLGRRLVAVEARRREARVAARRRGEPPPRGEERRGAGGAAGAALRGVGRGEVAAPGGVLAEARGAGVRRDVVGGVGRRVVEREGGRLG